MHLATHVADNVYYTKSFALEYGIYIGEPTLEIPLGPTDHNLVADMEFELDLYTTWYLTQDVTNPEHYRFCYERYITQDSRCRITMELYFVPQSEIDKCEVEYIDENHRWEWDIVDENQSP